MPNPFGSHDGTADLPRRAARIWATALVGLSAAGTATATPAPPQPPVDLGQTSFLDAEGRVGPLLELVGSGYGATRFNDDAGRPAGSDFHQTIGSGLIHPVYTSKITILGANLGGELLLPIAGVRNRSERMVDTGTGVGDGAAGAFLEWTKLRFLDRPLAVRFDVDVWAPIGSYRRDRAINAGSDVWQISPYLAFTWHGTDRWELSTRIIYDWSSDSNRPPSASGLSTWQPGDQLAVNLATSYALSPRWRLGIAGYALQQLHDAKADGHSIPASRQRVFAAGPGVFWKTGRTTFIGNVFREFEARNRPQGTLGLVRVLVAY